MDYSKLQKAEAVPEAASMIETFRAIGYSLETAVADIIDNSISANAKSIYINRLYPRCVALMLPVQRLRFRECTTN